LDYTFLAANRQANFKNEVPLDDLQVLMYRTHRRYSALIKHFDIAIVNLHLALRV
jgi:hypothetical protein